MAACLSGNTRWRSPLMLERLARPQGPWPPHGRGANHARETSGTTGTDGCPGCVGVRTHSSNGHFPMGRRPAGRGPAHYGADKHPGRARVAVLAADPSGSRQRAAEQQLHPPAGASGQRLAHGGAFNCTGFVGHCAVRVTVSQGERSGRSLGSQRDHHSACRCGRYNAG